MRSALSPFLLPTLLLFLGSASASAGTLTVQRDGSGDHTVIQDALDACAAGDTILIGPGLYTEYMDFLYPDAMYAVQVFALVETADVTLIGAGEGLTIIGPAAPMTGNEEEPRGVLAHHDPTGATTVEDLTVVNCGAGILSDGALHVRRVTATNNLAGISWYGADISGSVEGCAFQGNASRWDNLGVNISGEGTGITISDCTFETAWAAVTKTLDVTFERCEFSNVQNGFYANLDAQVTLRSCTFREIGDTAVRSVIAGTELEIVDCEIDADGTALDIAFGPVVCTGSTLSSGPEGMLVRLRGTPGAAVSRINGCHLAMGGRWAVYVDINLAEPGTADVVHDFTGNWWGSTDPATIAAKIHDDADDSRIEAVIDFEPFAETPVEQEATSLSGFKAMFR